MFEKYVFDKKEKVIEGDIVMYKININNLKSFLRVENKNTLILNLKLLFKNFSNC